MANTFIANYQHLVFSTKDRTPCLTPDTNKKLWPYLGGIAKQNKMVALCVGGMPDHIHMLVSMPATLSISKAVQLIKGGSSGWLNKQLSERFDWQEGYGSFSVSSSQIDTVHAYIQ